MFLSLSEVIVSLCIKILLFRIVKYDCCQVDDVWSVISTLLHTHIKQPQTFLQNFDGMTFYIKDENNINIQHRQCSSIVRTSYIIVNSVLLFQLKVERIQNKNMFEWKH